jgi:hypothetical protein
MAGGLAGCPKVCPVNRAVISPKMKSWMCDESSTLQQGKQKARRGVEHNTYRKVDRRLFWKVVYTKPGKTLAWVSLLLC